jgi:hypothetical protein
MSAGKGFMEKQLLRAYLQGSAFGPISAFPATVLLFLSLSLSPFSDHSDDFYFLGSFVSSLFFGVISVIAGYILILTFGTALWLFLVNIKRLNFYWFLLGSLIPPLLFYLCTKKILYSLAFLYYSAIIFFSFWYAGPRLVRVKL